MSSKQESKVVKKDREFLPDNKNFKIKYIICFILIIIIKISQVYADTIDPCFTLEVRNPKKHAM